MKISVLKKLSSHVDVVRQRGLRAINRLKSWGEFGASIRRVCLQLLEFISVLPGVVLAVCSLYTLLVPSEWLFSLLIFTFCCGVTGTILAIQTVLLKRKTYEVLRDIKGGIMIQTGAAVTEEQILNLIESSGTKVTLH